jgi:hypothetical protein
MTLLQMTLFAEPPTRASVDDLRDMAMAQVETAAERTRQMFAADAGAFVVRYLRTHGPTSGETLTRECRAAGIEPHDDRAFGPVYMRLTRAGVIEKCGTVRRERGHGTSGGNVWRLCR